jgi:predicted nucleic acid-binding protein
MRIYLDNCCLQRPLDDQTHPRIRVETEAVFVVSAAVQAGEQVLLGFEALEYEVGRIPDEARRAEVLSVLGVGFRAPANHGCRRVLCASDGATGVGPMDAIHLALASTAKADFFCTCDDRLLRKAQAIQGLSCKGNSA